MRSILISALLGLASAEVPAPQNRHAQRAATTNSFCAVVTKLVTAAKQQAAATSFCSSYLHIPKTVTTTTLTSTVTGEDVTTTSYASRVTITSTVTGAPTASTSVSSCPAPTNGKRGVAANDHQQVKRAAIPTKPSCLSSYAGAVLSTACKCLSIPTAASSTYSATTTVTTHNTITYYVNEGPTTTTTTVRATTTGSTPPPPSSCDTPPNSDGDTYSPYFKGCGVRSTRARTSSSRNRFSAGRGFYTYCQALQSCTNIQQFSDIPEPVSFEIYRYASGNFEYQCIFYDTAGQASDLDTSDNSVLEVYGYNRD